VGRPMIVFGIEAPHLEQPEEHRRQQHGGEQTMTILEPGEDESSPADLSATLFSKIMIAEAGSDAVKVATNSERERVGAGHKGS
jgi:hypothetical protein